MFFSDGEGIDAGSAGFASIFGNESTPEPQDAQDLDADAQDGSTAADDSSPQEELSAEEIVSARFDAIAAEEGVEDSDTHGEEEEAAPDEVDVSELSPDELRALAAEAITLKQQQTDWREEGMKAAVRQRVQEAEENAVRQVTAAFEQTVLMKSAAHYEAELSRRIAAIVRLSRQQDDPETYIIQNSLVATNTVMAARQQWESEQAADWDQRALEAASYARMQVPELRALYARDLAQQYGLPEAAIADIAHGSRHIENFDHRAQELADIAKTLGKERKKQAQQKRQDANNRLREQPIRTSASARSKGGKVPEYTGSVEEGAAIISQFRR